ncbi:AAA-11 multi-domain protein [Pyrenophora tritici-repentis]|nr:AAA-11 multi-domain protein [Pyrenophora tritici-repentis]KAI0613847.1 AAA-11 multi-domain protein [Pyrenophora tritici-repentis]KAI0625872.1 AAA-11 multi-domain protein [Pyrenophora tritici-repentis]
MGPDAAQMIFNCRKFAEGTDILKQSTSPEELLRFKTLGKEFEHVPNEEQQLIAPDTTSSEIGVTTIIGPPGCGKTMVDIRILWAHTRLGRRVMGAAPTNSARDSLVQGFIKQNSSRPVSEQVPDHKWVVFTGGQVSIEGALRLGFDQMKELNPEKELMERNSAYWAHLCDVYVGLKLLHRIAVWKSDVSYDSPHQGGDQLYTWANDFDNTKANLKYIQDPEQHGRSEKHIEALELTLQRCFLKEVSVCFCTISTSAHPLLLESGIWDGVIIDEAARETRAGMATIMGAFSGRIRHFTLSGDHWQGEGIVVSVELPHINAQHVFGEWLRSACVESLWLQYNSTPTPTFLKIKFAGPLEAFAGPQPPQLPMPSGPSGPSGPFAPPVPSGLAGLSDEEDYGLLSPSGPLDHDDTNMLSPTISNPEATDEGLSWQLPQGLTSGTARYLERSTKVGPLLRLEFGRPGNDVLSIILSNRFSGEAMWFRKMKDKSFLPKKAMYGQGTGRCLPAVNTQH